MWSEIESQLPNDTRELPDSITAFTTFNKPVLDTTLKYMLISLISTIYTEMMTHMSNARGEMVDLIETKMGEYATMINDLTDALDATEEE